MEKDQEPLIADQIQQMVEMLRALSNSDDCKKFVALLRSPACEKMVNDYREFITILVKAGEASRELWEPAFDVLSQISQEDRDHLLELALQVQPVFKNQFPIKDVPELTGEQKFRLTQWFPTLRAQLAKERGLIIQIIVALLVGLISNFPQHLDAIRAHQDAIQAHQDFFRIAESGQNNPGKQTK